MSSSSGNRAKRVLELSADRCPADPSEVADLYVLGWLTTAQADIFEEHFLQCPECAGKAELAFEFAAALKKYQE